MPAMFEAITGVPVAMLSDTTIGAVSCLDSRRVRLAFDLLDLVPVFPCLQFLSKSPLDD